MLWVIVGAISAVAGLVQTVTGFGAVVLMMLVLPFYFSVIDASALALTISQIFCMVLCWRYRKHIRLKVALIPTLSYTVCNLLALRMVGALQMQWLEAALAVFLILLSAYYLLVAKNLRVSPHWGVGVGCGAFSGVIAAFFAIGGPPMALYFMAATDTYYGYIACMQFLFVVTNITGIVGRIAGGLYSPSILPYAAVGTVCMIAGMGLGKMVSDRMDAVRIRSITYLFVGISGVILLLQNLL